MRRVGSGLPQFRRERAVRDVIRCLDVIALTVLGACGVLAFAVLIAKLGGR